MRSVFDQYQQPENQLTHALTYALGEDRRLLRYFIKEVAGFQPPDVKSLQVLEQQLPGDDVVYPEADAIRRGLPDAWIHDDHEWALLIESKVQALLTKDQLSRHFRMAERRGFKQIQLLVIGIKHPAFHLPFVKFKAWTEVYKWLKRHPESKWACIVAEYMEVWEGKMIAESKAYLTDGAVTVFSGVPFGDGLPYSYIEAKRLLNLAMDELRSEKELVRGLGMDPVGEGRGAITGKLDKSVWDFLRLKGLKKSETFTKYPHLTMALEHDRVLSIVTVPNGIRPEFRRNIINLGFEGFHDVMSAVNRNLQHALKSASGASPWVIVVQRRYPTQRSAAIIDGILQYDLRTAFPTNSSKQAVKNQSQWLAATYAALAHKKSNLQVAVGAIFPYRNCKVQKSVAILDYVVNTWLACKPLLQVMLHNRK